MTMTGLLWLMIVAIVAGGVFAVMQFSLRDLTRSVLDELCERRGNAAATARVRTILDDPDGHAATIGLLRIIANLGAAVAIVEWIVLLRGAASPGWVEIVAGLVLAGVLIWLSSLILPLSIARHAAERTVYGSSAFIRACYVALRPFSRFVEVADGLVRRLAGVNDAQHAAAPVEEVLSAVDEAQREGQFDPDEKRMIEAVIRFREAKTAQIMTPRNEVEALELTDNLGAVISLVHKCNHSRIPVYEGDLDHVAGIFYVKDLMRWLATGGARGGGKPFELRSVLRPAFFVPETKTVRELLAELLARRVHLALVADEYGQTSGVVTMEDIVEQVFGDIKDEYEKPTAPGDEVDVDPATRTARIDGRAYIDEANAALSPLGVELPRAVDYDTVGGLVITTLGRIPEAGDSVTIGRLKLTVMEAEPTRVGRIRLEVEDPPAAAEEEADAASDELRLPTGALGAAGHAAAAVSPGNNRAP